MTDCLSLRVAETGPITGPSPMRGGTPGLKPRPNAGAAAAPPPCSFTAAPAPPASPPATGKPPAGSFVGNSLQFSTPLIERDFSPDKERPGLSVIPFVVHRTSR